MKFKRTKVKHALILTEQNMCISCGRCFWRSVYIILETRKSDKFTHLTSTSTMHFDMVCLELLQYKLYCCGINTPAVAFMMHSFAYDVLDKEAPKRPNQSF